VTSPGNVSTGQEVPANNSSNKTPSNATPEPIDDALLFGWPAAGAVQSTFDEAKNKGIDISGKLGDAVLAAADGKVVYAGAGLRGYGNLVILKHSNNYLTAYAHNQTLLVREEQSVKKGQKIAEMGNSDSEQIKLHFEIRKQGKPIDPMKLLPNR
jgi:lipoprotein NlpD